MLFDRGEKIKLRLPFIGRPSPKNSWFKNDRAITTGDDRRILIDIIDSNTTLFTIDQARRDDSGLYTLLVANEHGEDKAVIDVQVMDVPGRPGKIDVTPTDDNNLKLQ